MNWKFKDGVPIYLQIVDELKMSIARGEFGPGDKLPAVRELAMEAGVNPNTMQRAYADLEQQGLVFSERTSGRFVTEDDAMIDGIRKDLSTQHLTTCTNNLKRLGLSTAEIRTLLEAWAKEQK